MATSDKALNAHFTDEYNELLSLYNDGEIDNLRRCKSGARKLLDEPVISPYHCIKAMLLLVSPVADTDEA
ncbi:hypothetical protein LTR95_012135 [Oleoguttula sp. CCFEE 5521]